MTQKGPSLIRAALFLGLLALCSAMHIGHSSSLHFQTSAELAALQKQQSDFEKSINNLIGDIQTVEVKVNATADTNQKVLLLEQAVTSQRQKINDLEMQIIPSFSLSKNSCQQLTSQQKVNLLEQLSKAKTELANLKALTDKMPTNAIVTQIKGDISKQETILTSIDKVIGSNCSTSAVLTPTIFQSNLYATNWILGRQSINNIVEQYYQRSRQYSNVTNCPLSNPFFDGKTCLKCEGSSPLFNLETSKCENCPWDTLLNQTMHTCQQIPHFTNYNLTENYGLDGAKELPKPDLNLTACPSTKPYYAGRCLECNLPSYWSVKDNTCKDCPTGQVFDINNKQCEIPQWDTMTYLEGDSRWVTSEGNFTKVLEERAKMVANTTVKFNTCGKTAPYFDGVKCITCPKEFDLNTKKCCEAPTGKTYNPNLHAYVTPNTNATTNPEAPNLLTTNASVSASAGTTTNGTTAGTTTNSTTNETTSTTVPKVAVPANACPLATPYYDGIACISCPEPYPLFDNATKKCVQCDPYHFFNSSSRVCQKRPLLFISANFTDVEATAKVSLPAYKAELLNKVNNSGNAIVVKCKPEEYSNDTSCFTCPAGERFNLELKQCTKCNGTIDTTTLICRPLTTKLSLLDANNTIWGANKTKADYEKLQTSVTGPAEKCPQDKPYAVKGLTCVACNTTNPYFDLSKEECVGCPKDLYYDTVAHLCDKEINITNTDGLLSFIETDNYTRANIKKQLEELSKTRKTLFCPLATPVASKDGSNCTQCTKDEFVDLRTLQCQKGKSVTNIEALNKTGKVLELGTFTLASLDTSTKATISSGTPTVSCAAESPLFNGTACISCPLDEYYNLQELSCYKPKLVSNVNALAASKRFAEVDANTLDNLNKNINSSTLPTTKCPVDKPLFDGQHCVFCPNGTYYNLGNNTCYTPQLVTNTKALANSSFIESGRNTLANIEQTIKVNPMPTTPCPDDKPLFNGSVCIGCPKGEFYNLQTLVCVKETQVSNVDGLNKTGKVIQRGEYTLVNLKAKIAAMTVPTKPCPAETPLFNGTICQACPVDEYYSLEMTSCFKPVHHSNISAINETHRVLERDNYTLQHLKDNILKDNLPTKDCPTATPMLSSNLCIACAAPKYYDIKTRSCYQPLLRTNVEALKKDARYIEIGNHTLKALNDTLNNSTLPTVPCPASAPIYDGAACHHCNDGEFFLLSNLTCIKAKNVTNVQALSQSKLYIQDSTHTLKAINDSIHADPYPSGPCPPSAPVLKANACFSCPQGEYIVLSNLTCYTPKNVTNVEVLNSTKKFVENDNHTLAQLKAVITAQKLPTRGCPADKPILLNGICVACPNDEYVLLSNLTCFKPTNRTNVEALAKSQLYIDVGNSTLANLNASIKANVYPTVPCPEDKPVFSNNVCGGCAKGQFVFLSNYTCYKAKTFTNTNALKALKNVVERGNGTFAFIEGEIKNQTNPVGICDGSTPMFDGNACINCSDKQYYVLDKQKCESAVILSNTDAIILSAKYVETAQMNMTKLEEQNKNTPYPKQTCPSEAPLFNGTACISCQTNLYELDLKKCINCISTHYYDSKTHSCKEKPNFYPNLTNKLWIVSKNNGTEQLKALITQRKALKNPLECPFDAPHFNNDTQNCEKCPDLQYFDYDLKKCTACAAGLEVDYNTRKCAKRLVGVYQTSLSTHNLLFEGKPKAQFQDEYDENKRLYPSIQDCPTDKPYFDGFECIMCPTSASLFSLDSKLCTSCPTGSSYTPSEKQCTSSSGELKHSDPTISKMYSSIF